MEMKNKRKKKKREGKDKSKTLQTYNSRVETNGIL